MPKKKRANIHQPKKPVVKFTISPALKAFAIFTVIIGVFFHKVLFLDHGYLAIDNLSPMQIAKPMVEKLDQGEIGLWYPYIFGGMPAYTLFMPSLYAPDVVLSFLPEILVLSGIVLLAMRFRHKKLSWRENVAVVLIMAMFVYVIYLTALGFEEKAWAKMIIRTGNRSQITVIK